MDYQNMSSGAGQVSGLHRVLNRSCEKKKKGRQNGGRACQKSEWAKRSCFLEGGGGISEGGERAFQGEVTRPEGVRSGGGGERPRQGELNDSEPSNSRASIRGDREGSVWHQ